MTRQADQLTRTMPADAASLLIEQMRTIIQSPQQSLRLGLIIALALALWSASGGVGNIVTAVVIWLIASLGFSLYVDNFGKYSKTYGALAGVVVLLLWLWITNFIVLLGAEINAEAEQQTVRDTTTGPDQPLGERGAVTPTPPLVFAPRPMP